MSRKKTPSLWAVLVVVLITAGFTAVRGCGTPTPVTTGEGEYLFCFWNVENLFDDRDGGYSHEPDKSYDAWFSKNPAVLREKLDNLSSALMAMNGGRGPDILAAVEVENERAAELLKDAMNKRIEDKPDLQYTTVLMQEVKVGRNIAPVVIARIPAIADRTRSLDRRRRILETHLIAQGSELVLMPSHWTSRVSDEEGGGREKYADLIYGRYRAMFKSNPDVDLLVCGDFNDTPDDTSVKVNLHAVGDAEAVRKADGELLFNLLAGRNPEEFASHKYGSKWFAFDQIVVSPGMLDRKGWSCDPESLTVVREGLTDKKGRPFPFGNERDGGPRGFSDHLPVTVRLRVHGE